MAIDTSTMTAGIALYGAAGLLAEMSWPAGRTQTTAILGETARLLDLSGLTPADLSGVAVAVGPGAFNGLRVGLSTAKGLSFSLGLPIFGVPTLDAVAYPHGGHGYPVRATIFAGRGRFVSALYDWPEGTLRRLTDYENTDLDGLAALITGPTLVCGELPQDRLGNWRELAPEAVFTSLTLNARRAGCLAELAWARFRRDDADDPDTLEPVYLHGPPAGDAPPVPARASAPPAPPAD
ncbi:MAG TPA: tRNA (adenosine(37)-N6)-threonylcarbamoyltransferase complex dimerization subunit type 1 TsaB [Thermomicrobiales bacterium]